MWYGFNIASQFNITFNLDFYLDFILIFNLSFNSKNAGLFEGSFFGGGTPIWPPLHISRKIYLISTLYIIIYINFIYNFIQLLKNLFKVRWKWKKMLTSSVISWHHWFLCNKEMSKNQENWWKLMKIANIDRDILHNFWTAWGISMKF